MKHFPCSCRGREDTIIGYYDNEYKYLYLNFITRCSEYMKIDDYWKFRNYPKRLWWRLKNCFKLLFIGYAEFEGDWNIDKSDELKNLIDYLNECHQKMINKESKN